MPSPTHEEYLKAVQVVDDYANAPDTDWLEINLNALTQIKGILKALRYMLRTEECQSVLERCATVMRRHDQMYAVLGHYGSKLKIESSEGRVVVKTEAAPHPDFPDFPGPQHG